MRNLKPPIKIEQEYTLTHSELERLLWLFGTHIAVTAEQKAKQANPTTCHTDTWVVPAVKKEMNNIREYYGE